MSFALRQRPQTADRHGMTETPAPMDCNVSSHGLQRREILQASSRKTAGDFTVWEKLRPTAKKCGKNGEMAWNFPKTCEILSVDAENDEAEKAGTFPVPTSTSLTFSFQRWLSVRWVGLKGCLLSRGDGLKRAWLSQTADCPAWGRSFAKRQKIQTWREESRWTASSPHRQLSAFGKSEKRRKILPFLLCQTEIKTVLAKSPIKDPSALSSDAKFRQNGVTHGSDCQNRSECPNFRRLAHHAQNGISAIGQIPSPHGGQGGFIPPKRNHEPCGTIHSLPKRPTNPIWENDRNENSPQMGDKGENSPLGVTWGMEIQNHRRNSNVREEWNMNDSHWEESRWNSAPWERNQNNKSPALWLKLRVWWTTWGKILMPWAYRSPTTKSCKEWKHHGNPELLGNSSKSMVGEWHGWFHGGKTKTNGEHEQIPPLGRVRQNGNQNEKIETFGMKKDNGEKHNSVKFHNQWVTNVISRTPRFLAMG